MRYIALLRGINVGGNNMVSMPALRECFEALGFKNVITYINSGNILFDADQTDKTKLVTLCERAIERTFGFPIVCSVITADELRSAVDSAPAWWGSDSNSKHNALFVIAPATTASVMKAIGDPKPEYEQVAAAGPVIFWSAPMDTFGRTRYGKVAGTPAYRSVTVRNMNTTRKLVALSS